jgi:cytochrome c553
VAECWNCGRSFQPEGKIARDSECPYCAAYLRCCRNCHFYERDAPNSCREPQAELQPEKELANACDYFREGKTGAGNRLQKPRSDFDNLFKD